MAADMGLSPEILDTEASPPDKCAGRLGGSVLGNTRGRRAGLMECLRSRSGQHKSWNDSIKAMRMVLLSDKRHQSDALEKPSLQTCLDKLQRAMKIVNQQSLIERLDLISRQIGMVFVPPTPTENHVILSSEMFKVIILLEGQSGIKDVRVGHQENQSQTSCEELVEVLSKGDFEAFISHLQGLLSIYNINGDKKQKTKGYLALSSLEIDLNLLAQLQSSINGVANYIHKSPLGILLPRRGGHPMKLIYFVSPYDLLCKQTRSCYPMTVEAITENDLGHSVTVCMEPSTMACKLQTMPLMSVKTADGKSLPSFQGVNNINSYSLCASFVLVLPQPVPIAQSIISAIQDITGLSVICDEEQSLMSLLAEQSSHGKTLPDQQHVYFLNNSSDSCLTQPGAFVHKIPFTHPTSVPNVLNLLRQQLMFNTVVQSFIRPSAKHDYRDSLVLELTTLSLQYLTVMFEHPLQDSMVTVEFDLSDITNAKCKLCMNNRDENICSDDFVSRAFQRCFSIPVTLRTVIHKVREQVRRLKPPEPPERVFVKRQWKWISQPVVKNHPCASNLNMTSVNTNTVPHQNLMTNLTNPPPYPVNAATAAAATGGVEPLSQGSHIESRKYNLGSINRTFSEPPPVLEEFQSERPPANPLLATLLDAESPVVPTPVVEPPPPNVVSDSPMLSKLLEETTSVASNPFPTPIPNPRKRFTKRKSKDIISGKSPKQRMSDSDLNERTSNMNERYGQGIAEKHIDLDSSGGSFDDQVRPSSVSSVGSVGGQSTGSVIDLTDIGESHVKKLENSLDSIMQKESRASNVNINYGMNVNSHMGGAPDIMDMHMSMSMSDFANQNLTSPMLADMGGDFQHPPPPWASRQTPPTPTSRNSPHHGVVPKNEKISTSLEDLLSGPGGRDTEGPNSVHNRRNSQQARRPSLKRQNSLGRSSVDSGTGGVSPDVFSPHMTPPGSHPLSSPSGQFPISSPNHLVSPGSIPLTSPSNSCGSSPGNPLTMSILSHIKNEPVDSKMGILGSQMAASMGQRSGVNSIQHVVSGGKPSLSALKAQLDMKSDIGFSANTNSQEKDLGVKEEGVPHHASMKLKLTNMRAYDSVSPPDSDGNKSRSSTFDFHSDDEEFTLPKVDKITVISTSPTRLQISNKTTLASFNKFNKSEKFKRKEKEKELKRAMAIDTDKKRKRDKDESRKERKKKKMSNASYSIENKIVYESTTVDVVEGNENNKYKPMPKLKITKSGVKMLDNNVLQVKEVKPEVKEEKSKYMKLDKEVVVKVEKVERTSKKLIDRETEKASSPSVKSLKENKEVREVKEKDKSSDSSPGTPSMRTPSNADEGIFDKINAMKTENLTKGEGESSSSKANSVSESNSLKKSSSKSQKSHKSQRSNSSSSKSDSRIMKTPTIKLKPIVVPSSGSSVIPSKSSPSTPSTPKSIAQSPTSTTIGKIGAVSLATSGSQKQLTQSGSSKSPVSQGSGKMSNSVSKSSGSLQTSLSSSSKSSSNLQKSVQIQGPSGKNSPVLQSSKSGHSRSLSASSVNSGSMSSSKSEKSSSKNLSSSSGRTSSPLSEREKSKSSGMSRTSSSSGRDRDRDKSTSSSKSNATTVITQETAASVLSFLNPKANKIASLPPIPKLSSTSGGQKVSTPTSTNNTVAPTSASTPTTNSNSKFVKGNSSNSMNFNKGSSNNSFNSNSSQAKGNNSFNKVNNNYSSSNRPQNPSVTSTANMNRTGNNSPVNYSQKGSTNQYNKGSNSSNQNSSSPGFRNNSNSGNTAQGRNNSVNMGSGQNSSRTNTQGSSHQYQNKGNNSSGVNQQGGYRGNNPVPPGNRNVSNHNTNTVPSGNRSSLQSGNSSSSNASNTPNFRGNNSGPNTPKGPGPPVSTQQGISLNTSSSDDCAKSKPFSANSTVSGPKGRKGSLTAVIDKLTCKATVPPVSTGASSTSSSSSLTSHNKVIIDESPASPEPESAAVFNKPEEQKVVIFDAPASPEPDNSGSAGDGSVRNCPRNENIVSIPLDIQSNGQYSMSSSQRDSKGSAKNNDKSSREKSFQNRPNSLAMSVSSSSSTSSPKIIPLNSPSEKGGERSTQKISNHKLVGKQNSVECVTSVAQQNGDIVSDEESKKLAIMDAKGRDRSVSPVVKSRTNTPTDLSSSVKTGSVQTKENLFKVPTPKSVDDTDANTEDIENLGGRRKFRSGSTAKTFSSSSSPVSSPENGLIIDCPSSPRHLQNKTNSPQCNSVSDSIGESDDRTSPTFMKSVGMKESNLKIKSSPSTSPLGKDNSAAPSVANSPCLLDDDLMEEALGIGN